MLLLSTRDCCCSSLSAPTPRGGQCGRMGNAAVVPSRLLPPHTYLHRRAVSPTMPAPMYPPPFVVTLRRELLEKLAFHLVGCAFALAASVGTAAHRWLRCHSVILTSEQVDTHEIRCRNANKRNKNHTEKT